MSSALNLQFFDNDERKEEAEYLYMLSVKTQYAGIELHKLLIHLLKYLSKKYLLNFNLSDEGEYWETGDEKLLQKNFDRYNFLIESVQSSLENFPMSEGETFESYFLRLMRDIQDRSSE